MSSDRRLGVLLLVLMALAVAALGLYLYGRVACPPPGWWMRLFAPSGNFGCVR